MIFKSTRLKGCYIVEPERHVDDRGFFARTYSETEFEAAGLASTVAECSISYNARRGTLRGMHYQLSPHEEAKLVRCTRGSVFDVAVDLRENSPTYGSWASVVLSADNRLAFFIPTGLAHGFLTLEDATELEYQISTAYAPSSAGGIRWDDPDLDISWPDVGSMTIAERDRRWPMLKDISSDT